MCAATRKQVESTSMNMNKYPKNKEEEMEVRYVDINWREIFFQRGSTARM
jgi:hypothetical protein